MQFSDDRLTKLDVKSYESTLQVVPNVTSVLLNHEKPMESAERSQFQPVSVQTTQQQVVTATHVVKHQFDDSFQKQQPSKRVPIKIVQDNRKNVTKPKPEISKTDVPVAKISTTVSLKQVTYMIARSSYNILIIIVTGIGFQTSGRVVNNWATFYLSVSLKIFV
jgi:hypothetical protein